MIENKEQLEITKQRRQFFLEKLEECESKSDYNFYNEMIKQAVKGTIETFDRDIKDFENKIKQ